MTEGRRAEGSTQSGQSSRFSPLLLFLRLRQPFPNYFFILWPHTALNQVGNTVVLDSVSIANAFYRLAVSQFIMFLKI